MRLKCVEIPASSSTLSRTLSNLISRFSSSNSSSGNPLPSARMRRISSVSCNRLMTQTRSLLGTSCSARCSLDGQPASSPSIACTTSNSRSSATRASKWSMGAQATMNEWRSLNLFHFPHGMLHSSSHRVLTVRVVVRKPNMAGSFEPRHLTFRELSGVGDEQFQRLVLCQMAVEMFKQLFVSHGVQSVF